MRRRKLLVVVTGLAVVVAAYEEVPTATGEGIAVHDGNSGRPGRACSVSGTL
jgi:hypothetical protein